MTVAEEHGVAGSELRPLLNVRQLAALLGVSTWVIYEWRSKGLGPPAIVINRMVRFDPQALAAWIEARAEEQT
jgi:predicted DNA-binding transcriptional regulator AlpA